jgi:hypothetical protein
MKKLFNMLFPSKQQIVKDFLETHHLKSKDEKIELDIPQAGNALELVSDTYQWDFMLKHMPFISLKPGWMVRFLPPNGLGGIHFEVRDESGSIVSVCIYKRKPGGIGEPKNNDVKFYIDIWNHDTRDGVGSLVSPRANLDQLVDMITTALDTTPHYCH